MAAWLGGCLAGWLVGLFALWLASGLLLPSEQLILLLVISQATKQ